MSTVCSVLPGFQSFCYPFRGSKGLVAVESLMSCERGKRVAAKNRGELWQGPIFKVKRPAGSGSGVGSLGAVPGPEGNK